MKAYIPPSQEGVRLEGPQRSLRGSTDVAKGQFAGEAKWGVRTRA
jgi:hypothetical protein